MSRRGILAGLAGSVVLGPASAEASRRTRRRTDCERFVLEEVELTIPGLDPAHEGLRIAQVSDIHIGRGMPDGRVLAAIRTLNLAEPDLAILTGDYVTTARDPLYKVPQLLRGIQAPAFAIMGNHDHYAGAARIRRDLEGVGYTVLQNEHTVTRLKGAPLTILGVDDGRTRSDDVSKTFKGAPTKGTRIVLAHTPPTANKLPAWQNLVCFSGHTHGGQIVIPRLTEGIFRRAGQPYIRGLYAVRGNQLYVNRGLGFGKGTPVIRVGSEPELTLITLRAA